MTPNEQNVPSTTVEEGIYEIDELAASKPDPAIALLERFRYPIVVLLAILTIVSFFPLKDTFSSPETYDATISTLDEKKSNVTALVASSTGLSAGISLLPDDAGSAIADKLMDVSMNLGIVLVVIYLEKYLLTVLGFTTFGILAPFGLIGLALAVTLLGRSAISRVFAHVAVRLLLLGTILVSVVPASVWVTDRIDEIYETSVVAADTDQAQEDHGQNQKKEDTSEDEGFLGFITGIPQAIASIPETIADGVTDLTQDILDQANALIEAFAVMIVTSCAVPILVLVLFLWTAHMLLGVKVEIPIDMLHQKARNARREARRTAASVRKSVKNKN